MLLLLAGCIEIKGAVVYFFSFLEFLNKSMYQKMDERKNKEEVEDFVVEKRSFMGRVRERNNFNSIKKQLVCC